MFLKNWNMQGGSGGWGKSTKTLAVAHVQTPHRVRLEDNIFLRFHLEEQLSQGIISSFAPVGKHPIEQKWEILRDSSGRKK